MSLAGRKPDAAWFDQIVDTLRLGDRLSHRPSELSGGQQQRVAVARALVSRPDLIFADEPTGNLDSRASAEILKFMRNAVDDLGQTIVMVTHDPSAASYADRVVFLADGKIVDEMLEPTPTACWTASSNSGADVFKLTLRGLVAHKLRFLLTGIAVVLGVAFVSGTLVFTDTVKKTFDSLFASVYDGTDAYVRSASAVKGQFGPDRARRGSPRRSCPTVQGVPGAAAAEGQVQIRRAQYLDRKGKGIGDPGQGAPTLGLQLEHGASG